LPVKHWTGYNVYRKRVKVDVGKAIRHFLRQAERFGQLLLVSDDEVAELYGEEVAAALTKLECIDKEKQICSSCGGYCCWNLACDLYAAGFHQCPVIDFRPLMCRFYFCDSFHTLENKLVTDLTDIFYNSFLALSAKDISKASDMISPLLAGASPELTVTLSTRLDEMRRGEIDPELSARLIRQEVEKYRISCNSGGKVT